MRIRTRRRVYAHVLVRGCGCVYAGTCVYAPQGAYTRVGAYTQAGVRIRGGCVYAGRGAYTRVGANTRFKMCVYAFTRAHHTRRHSQSHTGRPLTSCSLVSSRNMAHRHGFGACKHGRVSGDPRTCDEGGAVVSTCIRAVHHQTQSDAIRRNQTRFHRRPLVAIRRNQT